MGQDKATATAISARAIARRDGACNILLILCILLPQLTGGPLTRATASSIG